MFNAEIRRLLAQVITSWQVLVVSGVIVVYIFLVNYVAKAYHRRPRRPPASKKAKPEKPLAPAKSPKSDDDELGLEEADSTEE